MPVASRREYHLKWCSQKDGTAERLHMLLVEAGTDARLHRMYYEACGHEHLIVVYDSRESTVPPDEVLHRVLRLAFPAEMAEDYFSVSKTWLPVGGRIGHMVDYVGERVR